MSVYLDVGAVLTFVQDLPGSDGHEVCQARAA